MVAALRCPGVVRVRVVDAISGDAGVVLFTVNCVGQHLLTEILSELLRRLNAHRVSGMALALHSRDVNGAGPTRNPDPLGPGPVRPVVFF